MEVHEDFETLSNAAFASAAGFQSVAYSFLPFSVNSPTRYPDETGVQLSLPFFSLRSGQCTSQEWSPGDSFEATGFALLRYWLGHAPRLVTKKELLERVCADAYGSERSLWVGIGELLETLGDQARAPRFTQTVHNRGYRFVPPAYLYPINSSPISSGEKRYWHNCTDFWETPFKARAPAKEYRTFSHPSSW